MTMLVDAPVSGLSMDHWLTQAIELDASDLHVLADNPPTCRVHGRLLALREETFSAAEMKELGGIRPIGGDDRRRFLHPAHHRRDVPAV